MENKPYEAKIIKLEESVDPEQVWGSDQKIIEVIGLGSGSGFELKGVNLPKEWEKSVDLKKEIDPDRFAAINSMVCEKWGYSLEQVVFDKRQILTEAIIRKNSDNKSARIYLSDKWREAEEGKFVGEGLDKIQPAIIFQEIMSRYLYHFWGDKFDYGYVHKSGDSLFGGYGPQDLKIPEAIFNTRDESPLVNEYYKDKFRDTAQNIGGRFGVDIKDIYFDEKGVLANVSSEGDRSYYALEDYLAYPNGRQADSTYVSHNVDTAARATALHGIVASYINFLIDKDRHTNLL